MHVYGPVPSRRLGSSLGVSPIPSKACSYSCVYCQIGKTDKYSITPKSYYDKTVILKEIEQAVKNSTLDYITFAGDGEPTLSSDLAWLLRKCKTEFNIPTAVITNSSLIYQEKVAEALQEADLILPSIDAGCEKTFKKINRPHKDLDFLKIIDGLISFSKYTTTKIWTETMLVKDYNATMEEINKISNIITAIAPEKSFVMIPTRPPLVQVEKPNADIFLYAQKTISNMTPLDFTESGNFSTSDYDNLADAIRNIAARHPLRLSQAQKIAGKFNESIDELLSKGMFVKRYYEGDHYIIPVKLINTKTGGK